MRPHVAYDGPTSLEERIIDSAAIARVRLNFVTSSVVSETIFDGTTKYIAILEFDFSVSEYLKGSGSMNIVGYWSAAPLFVTRQDAEAALPETAAARDTRWDDREAIVFLQQTDTAFPSMQEADRYYLSWGGSWTIPDDGYSIASIHNKLWLPAASSSSQPSGDAQRFLLDVSPATGEAPTITLGEMKARIAAVDAVLAASDGSEEYMQCVEETYRTERRERYLRKQYPDRNYAPPIFPLDHSIGSGLAATSTLYEDDLGYGYPPDNRNELWLDREDSGLFGVQLGDASPYDSTGDGVNDAINFDRRVVTVRPLPAGVYKFRANELSAYFRRCNGYTWRYEWTVTVNAPEGTLHEAFFDPLTGGSAVYADGANGVLKPEAFTDANGDARVIQRIAWEADGVEMKLSPHTGLSGHRLDFIELDGTVSLSLEVSDATMDAMGGTLSWAVPSQPWEDGDKLMLRIRESDQ